MTPLEKQRVLNLVRMARVVCEAHKRNDDLPRWIAHLERFVERAEQWLEEGLVEVDAAEDIIATYGLTDEESAELLERIGWGQAERAPTEPAPPAPVVLPGTPVDRSDEGNDAYSGFRRPGSG